nr:MAG TPA: hypothetical protein [Caudoviricetes sp.]
MICVILHLIKQINARMNREKVKKQLINHVRIEKRVDG